MSAVSADFQVAILMNDIVEAKRVSDELREIGIFAHYYNSLDEMWLELNTTTPDLCIVDVKLMSQGTLLFKSHPKVKSNVLKYCFYYKESTKALLSSTFGLKHYGLIRSEISLADQLKSALRRRNDELRLQNESDELATRLERLKLRSKRLSETVEIDSQKQKQHGRVLDLIKNFGIVKSPNDFMDRVISMLTGWDACHQFGIYHLNKTGQKLVSPKIKKDKYKVFPDLWLATECNEGINDYARAMAFDVTFGLMDGDITSLSIRGDKSNPDILILADFDKKEVENFEWKLLEMKLESEYRSSLIKFFKQESKQSFEESIYKTFGRMDDIQYHQVEAEHKFVLVDFSTLTHFLGTQLDNRFHWNSFHKEFVSELAELLNPNFKVSILNFDKFVVSIDKKNLDVEFQKLKAFTSDFEVWRYFEDTTVMFANDLEPKIKFLNPSSLNTVRVSSDQFAEVMQPNASRDQDIIFNQIEL